MKGCATVADVAASDTMRRVPQFSFCTAARATVAATKPLAVARRLVLVLAFLASACADAGTDSGPDSGTMAFPDTGSEVDAGAIEDAATDREASVPADASTDFDAAQDLDGGTETDAATSADAAEPPDAATILDAQMSPDASPSPCDACSPDATCDVVGGTATCVCRMGFDGDGVVCVDVDECALAMDRCDFNAACTNTVGSYTCACDAANCWYGDGFSCVQTDECLCGNPTQGAQCEQVSGSCSCYCQLGYVGDGLTCTDVDECADPASCAPQATCTNDPGTYRCACGAGYLGDGYGPMGCTDANECLLGSAGCSPDATCTNTIGGATCACNPGFVGDGFACAPTFTVAGAIFGLYGSGLTLRLEPTDEVIVVATNGSYAFTSRMASSTPYRVVVDANPADYVQTCVGTAATEGTLGTTNVTNAHVTCGAVRTIVLSHDFGGTGLVGDGTATDCATATRPAVASLAHTFTVPDIHFAVRSVVVRLRGLSHTYAGDLEVAVDHADGATTREVPLFSRLGADGSTACGSPGNYGGDYDFGDAFASTLWTPGNLGASDATLITPGGYRASGSSGVTRSIDATADGFGGRVTAGAWTVSLYDLLAGDTGSLAGVTLELAP